MKTKVLLALFAVLTVVCLPTLVKAEVRWLHNVDQATVLAQQTNRLVLLHFWSTSCPPCVKLERNVYSAPGVSASMESNFVPVKINVDDNKALARAYGVRRWPTDVILTPDGRVITAQGCKQDPAEYLSSLQSVTNEYRRVIAARIAAGPPPTANAPVATVSRYQNDVQFARQPQLQQASQTQARRPTPTRPSIPTHAPMQARPPASTQAASAHSPVAAALAPPVNRVTPTERLMTKPAPQIRRSLVGDRYTTMMPTAVTPPAATRSTPAPTAAAANPVVPAQASSSPLGDRYSRYNRPSAPPMIPPTATTNPATPAVVAVEPPIEQSQQAQPVVNTPADTVVASAPPVVATSPPSAPAVTASRTTPTKFPLALEGRCSVTILNQRKWAKGDARWGAIHRGHTFLFAGSEEQKTFLADPDRYTPVLGGHDPVIARNRAMLVPGDIDYGLHHNDRIFLFANKQTLDEFFSASVDAIQRQANNAYETHIEQAEANSGIIRR